MKKGLLLGLVLFCLSAGGAFAQEFTATPRNVRPQPVPPRPAVEEGSNSSILNKVFTAPRKYQLLNPGAPESYGSGQQVIFGESDGPTRKAERLEAFFFYFSKRFA